MFCGFCGKTIPDNAAICPVCGARTGVTPAQAEQPAAPAPAPSPAQPNYQQPSYGAPAQPNYQQPSYGAPAQPNYQQPSYGAPAQPNYQQPRYGTPQRPNFAQQPYGAPARPNYQQGYPATRPASGKGASEKLMKIGRILATILSAAAAAAVLVAAIVWIVDMIGSIGDLNKAKSYMNNDAYGKALGTYIMYIADNAIRVLCLVAVFLLCLRKKADKSAAAGVWMIVFSIPTLVFLASYIFDFKLFGVSYRSSFSTSHVILAFLFLAAVVVFTVTLANKSAVKKTGLILAGITVVLLIASLILTIVVYSDNIGPLNDYISATKKYGGSVSNSAAKVHTEYVFCFLAMLFAVLTMTVVTVTSKFFNKEKRPDSYGN